MGTPLVSIIIPSYNREHLISETLDSVLAQTYQNWECIVVDDGSTDRTGEIINNYTKIDNRIKYFRKKNGGTASARNYGLDKANGDYIQFIDSDDLICEQKLDLQLNKFFQNNDLIVVLSNFNYIYYEHSNLIVSPAINWNNKISNNFLHDIVFRWDNNFSIPIHTALIKKEFVEKIWFNENIKAKEDWLFWIDLALLIDNKVEYLDITLASYRIHNSNKKEKNSIFYDNYLKVLFLIYDKLIGRPESDAFIERLKFEVLKIHNKLLSEYFRLNDNYNKQQHSYAYQTGKFLLKPLSFIRKIFSK